MQNIMPPDCKIGIKIAAVFGLLVMVLGIGYAISFWTPGSLAIVFCLVIGLVFTCIALFQLKTAVLIMIALFPLSYAFPIIHTPFFDLKLVYILNLIVSIIFLFRFSIEKESKFVKSPLNLPLVIFLLVNLVSIVVSGNVGWSVKEFVQLLHYVLIYFVVLNVIKGRESIRKAIGIFIVMGVISALVGLSQFVFGKPVIPQLEISGPSLNAYYPGFQYNTIMAYRRVSSLFAGDALRFANFLLPLLLILIGIILGRGSRGKVGAFGALGIMMAAFLVTFTRGAWIGFLVGLLVMIALVDGKRRAFILFLSGLLLLPFFLSLALKTRMFIETSADIGRLGYLYLWKIGWSIIKDNPILGTGCGGTQLIIAQYTSLTSGPSWLFENATKGYHLHNGFLTLWAETGIIGLWVDIWILVRYLKSNLVTIGQLDPGYWKLLLIGVFTGVIGLLVHFLTITGLVENFWILLAINMGLISLFRKDQECPSLRERRG